MKGIVKHVNRTEWSTGASNIQSSSVYHNIRHTNTYAELEDGTKVDFDEKDVLQAYNRTNFSDKLVKEIELDLTGRSIDYIEVDGEYKLDGSISQYI